MFRCYCACGGDQGSDTYRPEILGRVGVGRPGGTSRRGRNAHAGPRWQRRRRPAWPQLSAAAVSEISHFGLGGECRSSCTMAARREVVVINGQGSAPAAASPAFFRRLGEIPPSGPLAGTVPAVVDALASALAEFGSALPRGGPGAGDRSGRRLPWYDYLTQTLTGELEKVRAIPSGARVYLQGPGGTIPQSAASCGSRTSPRTLRSLAAEEQRHGAQGRKAAIYTARDHFYRGDVGQRIARAVQEAGGLLTAEDLAGYRGRAEAPTRLTFRTRHGSFEVFKTGFWGQGPVLLQRSGCCRARPRAVGHNSAP